MCGQLHDDDCVDPKDYFKPMRNYDAADKKAKQLCRQAFETLEMAFSDCDQELMQSMFVASVVPAPDSSRLLVTVGVDLLPVEFSQPLILALLRDQTPRLRAELARSISRKRVPNLTFRVFSKVQLELGNGTDNSDSENTSKEQSNG